MDSGETGDDPVNLKYSEDHGNLLEDQTEILGPQGDSDIASHLETRKVLRPVGSDETTESSGHGSSESIGLRSGPEDADDPPDAPEPSKDGDSSDSGWDTDLEIEEEIEPKVYDATGKNMYLKACKDIGVVPASTFIRHISSTRIDMKHHGLGPQGAKAISMALVTNTSVLTLDLEDNWMEGEGGAYVAEMLKENCYITDLDAYQNIEMQNDNIDNRGAASFERICRRTNYAVKVPGLSGEMLQQNTCLRRIQLRGNEFKDRDAKFIAEALKSNYIVKELILNHNEFGEIGGEILGEGIAANESIEYLDLSWNHLRRKGAIAVCRGLVENISLKKLDLSWNGFGNEGALAMAEALKFNSSVEWIDLSNNRITDEGALVLSKGLEVNDVLRTLKLTLNPLTAAGAMALLLAIEKNSSSGIEELDLTGIVLNRNVMEVMNNIQKSRPEFTVTYQGSIGQFEVKLDDDLSPLALVQDHLKRNNLRVWDLFKAYDKDKNQSVSVEEFRKGIEGSGIKLKARQFKELVEVLDKDDSGEIDFSEFLGGNKNEQMKQRTERKQKMVIAQTKRKNRLYAPVAEQFGNLSVKDLKRPISPDRRTALKGLIKKDVSQWDQDGHKAEKLNLALRSLDQTLNFTDQGTDMTKEEILLSKSMGPPKPRSPSPNPSRGGSESNAGSPGKKTVAKKRKKKSPKKKLYKPKTTKHLYDIDV